MANKWQYMSVWIDRDWKVQTIVGFASEKFGEMPRFVEFLNVAGQMHWELITMVPVEVGHRAFFKRQEAGENNADPREEEYPETMEA